MIRSRVGAALVPLFLFGGLTVSCAPGDATKAMAQPPKLDLEGQTQCAIVQSHSRPLVVEWPAADRAALEAQIKKGVVAVHYEGCTMDVLRRCRVKAGYKYTPITPKRDQLTIKNSDELRANLPLGALKLEGTLKRAGQLNVSMTFVGTYELDRDSLDRDALDGECKDATHVLYAASLGAFDFFAGGSAEATAGASVLGAKAGAGSSSTREKLVSDGNVEACAKSARGDREAPDGCSAPIRVEVMALGAKKEVVAKPRIELGEYGPRNPPPPSSPDGVPYAQLYEFLGFSEAHLSAGPAPTIPELPDVAFVQQTVPPDLKTAFTSLFAKLASAETLSRGMWAQRDGLRACTAKNCDKEAKLRADLEAAEKARAKLQEAVRADADALAKRAEAQIQKPGAHPSAELFFARGLSLELAARASFKWGLLTEETIIVDHVLGPAIAAYGAAKAISDENTRLGFVVRHRHALLSLANAFSEKAPNSIVDGWIANVRDLQRLPRRPESADLNLRLANVYLGRKDTKGAKEALDRVDATYPAIVQRNATFLRAIVACDEGRWPEADIRDLVTKAEVAPSSRTMAYRLSPREWGHCLWRAGGLERDSLNWASGEPLAEVLFGVGLAAVERYDYSAAMQAFQTLVQRAPNSTYEAIAQAHLSAGYTRMGDVKAAQTAEDRMRRSPQSLERIPVPQYAPLPTTDEERRDDVKTRLRSLVNRCYLENPVASKGEGRVDITIELVEARPPNVTAKLLSGDASMSRAVSCIEATGAPYFRDAQASAHAIAKVIIPN